VLLSPPLCSFFFLPSALLPLLCTLL
jgi:hypothetical protein